MRKTYVIALAALVLAATGVWAIAASAGDGDVGAAREATAKFQSLDVARGAGYGLFRDVNGIACIAMPGLGAMGVHYVNGALVGDPGLDPRRPEALRVSILLTPHATTQRLTQCTALLGEAD